jgi:hypothetical protein
VHPRRQVCVYVLGGGRAFLKRAPAGARLPLRPRWPLGVCVFRAAGGGSILGVSAHPTRSPPCNFHPRMYATFIQRHPAIILISLSEQVVHVL